MNKAKKAEIPKDAAMKYDGMKTRVDLFPARAYLSTCQAFTYKGEAYAPGNWKSGDGFDWSRLIASAERHLLDFKLGINYDKDSGLPVLAHHMCCGAMLLENFLTDHGNDDRHIGQMIISGGEVGGAEDILRLLVMDPVVMRRAQEIKQERLSKQLALQQAKKG